MPDGMDKQEQAGAEALTPLARLPDHKKLDEWLGVHMAKAAKEYDDAVHELKNLHASASGTAERVKREIDQLSEGVEAFLDGKAKMTPKLAKDCLRLMELERKYIDAVHTTHAAHAATYKADDPNRPAVGREMGTSVGEWAKRRSTVEQWPKGVDGDKFLDGTGEPEPEPEEPKAKPAAKKPVVLRPDADLKNADWLRPNDPDNPKNRKAAKKR